MSSSYARLLHMLTQGWRIHSPVYVRPRWSGAGSAEKRDTYHFVLWSGDRVSLISVAESPEVEQLVTSSGLSVDRR